MKLQGRSHIFHFLSLPFCCLQQQLPDMEIFRIICGKNIHDTHTHTRLLVALYEGIY